MMKRISFLGSSLDDLRHFPQAVRREFGFQLHKLQEGEQPDDWKPMPTVGAGAAEVRVRDVTGTYRTIYVAKLSSAIHVLHVFKKQTQKTSQLDIEIARQRYKQLLRNKA